MLTLRTPALVFLAVIFTVFAATSATAQTPNAPPTPPLQINVRNVLIDVVVTDKKGSAVPGLHKEDFQVLENGKPQAIEYFEPHFPSASVPAPPAPPLPPNTFTNVPVG